MHFVNKYTHFYSVYILKSEMFIVDYDGDSGFSQATMNHAEGFYL